MDNEDKRHYMLLELVEASMKKIDDKLNPFNYMNDIANGCLDIIKELAESDPDGIIDYDGPYSNVTPGEGATFGCIFCKMDTYSISNGIHHASCIWQKAVNLLKLFNSNHEI